VGRAGAARAVFGGFAAAIALLPATAGAAVLEPEDVPGLDRAGQGKKVARAALGTRPPRALKKADTEGVAFAGRDSRVETGVFFLDSEKQATRALRAVGRGARKLDLADGAVERSRRRKGRITTTVVVRVGEMLGAVRFASPLAKEAASQTTRAYASLLVGRMEGANAWDRTLAGVSEDGSVTPELALRAFAIAYGPLPGVKRPKGPLGEPEPGLAGQLVLRTWDQIGAEQRAAIETALAARYAPGTRAGRRRAEAPSTRVMTPSPQFQAIADFYAAEYAKKLSMSPPPIRVFAESVPITIGVTTGTVGADAYPLNAAGTDIIDFLPPAGQTDRFCRIRVPPAGQAFIGDPILDNIIAHEVFHCFQFRVPQWSLQAYWIREGGASWAGDTITGTDTGHYQGYLQKPARPLFQRDYDANGFFGRADEMGGAGSLWGKFPTLFATVDNPAAYALVTNSLFASSWASSMFRLGGAGPDWNQTNPHAISFAQLPLAAMPIVTDTTIGSSPYQTSPYLVGGNPERPLVSVVAPEGGLRAANSTADFGFVENRWFCVGGQCKCPPGKVSSIPDHVDAGPVLFLALTGGAVGKSGRVTLNDPKKFCDEEDPNPSSGGPSGPGGTNGDPHMTSMDGLHHDFQGAGEFTLLRSSSGDIDIQARQEPWLKSERATINTQIAMGVEGRRVTVSAGSGALDPPVARIDGAVDPLAAGETRALGNGSVTRTRDDGWIVVTWPDGSKATVRGVGSYGVAATVQLAAGRTNAVAGLLGDFDGNPANDLATRAGKDIPYTAKRSSGWPPFERFRVAEEYKPKFFDDLYDTVGDSWRIEQRDSLFDYGPGQSTKTFTDRSIPERPLDPSKISARARARAERICLDMGVTEEGPLRDCIIDLFVTGRVEFAEDALIEQETSDATFARLGAGAARVGDLSLLETGDGSLHIGFNDRAAGGMVDVRLDQSRAESQPETIAAVDSEPFLFAGPNGGVRAESAELRSSGASGIYQYARSGDGSWQPLGAVATGGFTYASRPFALFRGDTLFTASPMAGVGRIFRGAPAGPGVEPTASKPDCYGSSPTLARDEQSGELWVAWMQWDCPEVGLFVQQLDPATGNLVGSPQMAPGSSNGSTGSAPFFQPADEPLAFTGRPGQAGVFLAYPGTGSQLSLWRVGEPGPTTIPGEGDDVGQVELKADPADGRLWLAWEEGDRVWLGESDGGPLRADPRPVDPPPGSETPLFTGDHWNFSASPGALDVLYGYQRTSSTPGGIWHARVPAG
jgi:hypothetical protein